MTIAFDKSEISSAPMTVPSGRPAPPAIDVPPTTDAVIEVMRQVSPMPGWPEP